MVERKFIPGGRYLYAAGREWHQVNNCFLFRAEDSSEGWSDTMGKITAALMSGGGIGVDYSALRPEGAPIKRKGGFSTGPIALMQMVNEAGRHIMQGGARRSAIWAGLAWDHPDISKFIRLKDWSSAARALKEQDFTFPMPMELTNISVIYDSEFFQTMNSLTVFPAPAKPLDHEKASKIWLENCRQAFKTAEPGMSFNFLKDRESLRNACVRGDTEILTDRGYVTIQSVVNTPVNVWNGFEWSTVTPKITGRNQRMVKVTFSDGRTLVCTEYHDFHLARGYRGDSEKVKAAELRIGDKLIKHGFPVIEMGVHYADAYTQGFISADGMDGYDKLYLYEPKYICESRLNGTQVGNVYSAGVSGKTRKALKFNFAARPKSFVPHDGDLASRLNWLAGLIDGDGTELKEGGCQIGSVDREFLLQTQKMLSTLGVQAKVTQNHEEGLRAMPDGHGGRQDYLCQTTYRLLIGATQMQALKHLGLKCERLSFNKQPQRDASQFVKIVGVEYAGVENTVYCFNEPKRHLGVFAGVLTGQCCEVTSEDDSDKCNLGTVWMNRCDSADDFHRVCRLGTLFLLCGGVYSDVPTEKIRSVGLQNNRIGLGVGGMHEWLMQRGMAYECTEEMHKWLYWYVLGSEEICDMWSPKLGVNKPKGIRAIAPNGSIGILAETTTGIEPLFCKAYKRRYFKDGQWHSQYVVDGAVKSLVENGVKLEHIKDSYDLTFEQRIKFQADVQQYVDMSISSTCNMPAWGSETNNENTVEANAATLLKYAHRLRGFTCYPDGARGGQPLTRVSLEEAFANEGKVTIESSDVCDITKGGSCSS